VVSLTASCPSIHFITCFMASLTDQSQSGDYFVGESDIQMDMAIALLCVLHGGSVLQYLWPRELLLI